MKLKNAKKRNLILLVVAGLLVSTASGLLARYVSSNRRDAQMISAQFHISSNYLEETDKNASYTIADWGDGLDIMLYNYEKENIDQIAADVITYQVEVTNGSCQVKNQNGSTVAAADSSGGSEYYTISGGTTRTSQSLHIVPTEGATNTTVKVITTAPFQKTLQASFTFTNKKKPTYTWEEITEQNYVLLTISTNDYSGTMTVTWDSAKLSPDNTDTIMRDWVDTKSSSGETFTAEANTTYELIFVKNTVENIAGGSGIGTEINLAASTSTQTTAASND
jgi:hypothetical protein